MAVQKKIRSNEGARLSTRELEARLLARGELAKQALLKIGGKPLTQVEVAATLHLGEDEVERLREGNALVGLPVDGTHVYPTWQFHDGSLLPGLAEVLQALQTTSPWMRAAFLLGTSSYLLDKSPLTELEKGNVDAVIRAAGMLGEHGAA